LIGESFGTAYTNGYEQTMVMKPKVLSPSGNLLTARRWHSRR
jgi:hypothetical protein